MRRLTRKNVSNTILVITIIQLKIQTTKKLIIFECKFLASDDDETLMQIYNPHKNEGEAIW